MIYKAILDTPVSWRQVKKIEKMYAVGKTTNGGSIYSTKAILLLFGKKTFMEIYDELGKAFYSHARVREGITVHGISDYALIRMVEHHNHKFEKEYDLPALEELIKIDFDVDRDTILSPEGVK